VKIIADPQARVANMIAGSGEVMPAVPRADFDRMSKEPNLESRKVVTTVWDDILMNNSKKPLNDQRVRQALNFTVDREKFNKLAYFGQLQLSQREFPKGHWALNEKANQRYTFDLEKAKALLAQAGLASGFETSINVGLRPEWKQYAQIWAQDLAKIGVKLQIKELETAVFYTEYNKMEWDIFAFASGIGKQDPSGLVASSPYRPIDNRTRLETQPFFDEYKKLWDEGLASRDLAVRKKAYDRIQEILAESGHIIVLGFSPVLTVVNKRVQDFLQAPSTYQYYASTWLKG